jgi:acyl carrier protein
MNNTMSNVNVIALFTQAALEVNGKKLDGLTKDTIISKLGLDSVAVMELVSFFEEKLNIRMPDEDLAKVQTLGDLGEVVRRLVPTGTQVTI